ncbi:CudA family protein [Entamoeba marina]
MTLVLERQTSSSTETLDNKQIYVVVKQSIFSLTITSPHRIDGDIDCELVYDTDDLSPVGYIAQTPLLFKVQQITSNTINIECKLTVLSSQHEDLLFKVLVKLVVDGAVVGTLYSEPIKSTSKADSHKKTTKKATVTKPKKVKKEKIIKPTNVVPKQNDEHRQMEINIIKSNELLIQTLSKNISMQNQKCTTMSGSLSEFIWKLTQYDYSQHSDLICNVLSLFTQQQLSVLQEISAVIGSACPFQYQLDEQTGYIPYQEFNTFFPYEDTFN